jgi:hypothetical protein
MSIPENIVDLQRALSTSTPNSFSVGNINSLSDVLGTPSARGLINEIWVGIRPDLKSGSGTAEDPFDGGTQSKLDALMPTIAANTKINFEPGTFFTNGITVKEGWIIVGSGETETIIKLSPGIANTSGNQADVFIQQSGFLNYAEIRDLTTDCNAANQGVATGNLNGYLDAVMIQAKSARLINLTCLGIYGKPGEGFPIHIEHDGSSGNNDFVEITNVKAIDPVGNMTVISGFDQSGGQVAGIIQNCSVSCSAVSIGMTAYGGRRWNNFSILNSRCVNTYFGVTIDTEDFHNVDIDGNNFKVGPGADLAGGTVISFNGTGIYDNIRVHRNYFEIAAVGGTALQTYATGTAILSVIGNTIVNHGGRPSFSFGTGTSGLVSANTVTENVASTFPSGIKLLGNTTPAGTALYGNSGIASQADVDARFDLTALQNTWSSTGYKVWDFDTTDDGANLKRMRLAWNAGHFQIIALNDNLTQKFTWMDLEPDGSTTIDKIYTNSIKFNTGQYINLSPTEGSSGYGFRDNAGVVEVKNYGGDWNGVNARAPRVLLTETTPLTLPVGSDSESTASGTLATVVFSGTPSYTQDPIVLRLFVSGGPRTITIPSSYRLGETTPVTTLIFQNGWQEANWVWSNGKYLLVDTADGTTEGLVRVSNQFDKTDTTLGNVTGLSLPVAAGKTYAFHAKLYMELSPGGAGKVSIGGTATATSLIGQVISVNNATLIDFGTVSTLGAASCVFTDDGNSACTIDGTITVNAAGTLTVMFAQNSASGTSSVLVGSTFEVREVA